jgi:hypothetical protein
MNLARTLTPISLIPVLVTGIQRAQVLGRERLLACMTVVHGADAPWLDPCDEHRDEGGEVGGPVR